jgi:HSP20 family protein
MSSLMRWDPFRGLARMQRDMDHLFSELFGQPLVRWERGEEGIRVPSMDLVETEQELILKAELPGVDKDKIQVEVMPDSINLSGEISHEREEDEQTHHYRERFWGRFERSIPLPVEVISEQAKANYRDGILEIHLPKSERARAATPRKVKIE